MLDVAFVEMAIKAIVLWGLSGYLAYEIMKQWVPWLKTLGWNDFHLRWLALGLASLISLVAWAVGLELGMFPFPDPSWQAWFVDIFAVIGMATGANQFIHGWKEKRGEDKPE